MNLNLLGNQGTTEAGIILMKWVQHTRKLGGSIYIVLPHDYVKAKGIEKDQLIYLILNGNGSLTIIPKNPGSKIG